MAFITIGGISKTFNKGNLQALNNVSVQIDRGELFGFIGPDGAGKTTLFRIITTLMLADSGNIQIDGLDVVLDYKLLRKQFGYMPGKFSLYLDLTVEENLNFYASVFNTDMTTNYHLIKDIYIQLEPFKNRRAGQLSGGMKQKLALCCALIHEPKFLVLDEPTTGVDAVSRKEFWGMLQRLKQKGMTIIVSTPYMDEAAQCDRIALMQNGNILDIGHPDAICDRFDRPLFAVQGDDMLLLLKVLREFELTEACFAFGDSHHLRLTKGNQEDVIQFLNSKGLGHANVTKIKANIEDTFMQLMTR
jgi:ABC-type multidrug transport system ATPase subunit